MTPDQRSTLFRLVAINAYRAYLNSLVGDPCEAVREFYERVKDPRPGDVVLETSTVYQWAYSSDETPRDQYPALGTLLRVAFEPIMTQDALDQMHADGDHWVRANETLDEIPKEKVWYIKPLDETVPEYRWTNADFIVVSNTLKGAV